MQSIQEQCVYCLEVKMVKCTLSKDQSSALRGCVMNTFNGILPIGIMEEEFQHVQEDYSIEKCEQSAGNQQNLHKRIKEDFK